jgi:hypothetical protein
MLEVCVCCFSLVLAFPISLDAFLYMICVCILYVGNAQSRLSHFLPPQKGAKRVARSHHCVGAVFI